MSQNIGTLLGAPVRPADSNDQFPAFHADEGKGGFYSVADITARDAIFLDRRVIGLRVKVLSDGKDYELVGGITNSDWVEKVYNSGTPTIQQVTEQGATTNVQTTFQSGIITPVILSQNGSSIAIDDENLIILTTGEDSNKAFVTPTDEAVGTRILATRQWVEANATSPAIIIDTPTFTAESNRRYITVVTTEVTDPTPPSEGANYEVFVRNGVTTIAGVNYTEGTTIRRVWHSGAWQTYVVANTTTLAVSISANINTSQNWNGRNVILNNDANLRTITVNGNLNTQGIKTNNGSIQFMQGAGRTLVNVYGTSLMDGLAGSFFSIVSVGTTDYLTIDNV